MVSSNEGQISIPCSIYRGGTSKAVFFLETDLPSQVEERKSVLLRVMGSPDWRQIDGLGGADPLTSRVGIVSKDPSGSIRFQFAFVHIQDSIVEFEGFCGNIISAVGPYAISQGLVKITEPITKVAIYDVNTEMNVTADIAVKKGDPLATGTYRIAGVPNPGSKISLHFHNPCEKTPLLPTKKAAETLQASFGTIPVSLIHCIDPVIFVRAQDLNLHGDELPEQFEKNLAVIDRLEELRNLGAQKMGIPCSGYLPKIAWVSPSKKNSSITARMLSLGTMHKAYAISCGSCTAAAASVPGSLVNQIIQRPISTITIHHPQGDMEITVKKTDNHSLWIEEIVAYRTARLIMKGDVYLPALEANTER